MIETEKKNVSKKLNKTKDKRRNQCDTMGERFDNKRYDKGNFLQMPY